MPHQQNRSHWPYPALLPHSIKVYPVVQMAPEVGAQPQTEWPRRMAPDVAAWREQTSSHKSLGNQLYVHIPFCPFICGFCPLYKVKMKDNDEGRREAFVAALVAELDMYGKSPTTAGTRFDCIYFGGGTPTELTPGQLGRILTAILRNFTIPADAEITLEGVAKQMLAPGYLEAAAEQGFNRVSFGVQSLDIHQRRRIGRGDDVTDYPALIELARSFGDHFKVNCEIMAGLPEQTFEGFESDLRGILSWNADSLDILYYIHMAGTRLAKLVARGRRAAPKYGAHLLKLRQLTNNTFREVGWQQETGEVFVKSERDLFVHTGFGGGGNGLNTILACGPSAFGQVGGAVYQNVCDLDHYFAAIGAGRFPVSRAQSLDLKIAKRRALLLGVLRLRIPDFLISDVRTQRIAASWKKRGLVAPVPGGYKLTELGTDWYNLMQMDVLPVVEKARSLRLFSSLTEQWRAMTGKSEMDGASGELLALARGTFGKPAEWGYKALLSASRKLPMLDDRAIGFTGPVEA